MRGEHVLESPRIVFEEGSSPHARGTQIAQSEDVGTAGIIPACAGNTMTITCRAPASRDHPRMRGEHKTLTDIDQRLLGSSPHARGTLPCRIEAGRISGIIPACAGNTSWNSCWTCRAGDHPRMRGEHNSVRFAHVMNAGSSPHARGTLLAAIRVLCAAVDHPRMRGEHLYESGSGH